MSAYLFVHFKQKTTPQGEQVYFSVSKDGYNWGKVNEGQPVLWAYYGDKGVRDFTIVRHHITGKFYILATDLSLSYGMRHQYHDSWEEISRCGSKYLSLWESEDLINWTEQRLIKIGDEEFGCMWAPDIIFDREEENYVIHWSSSHRNSDFKQKGIYYCRTTDFKNFTKPELLYLKEGSEVIDSAIYEEDGHYYMFVKSENNPARMLLLKANHVTGPYTNITEFENRMARLEQGKYEAPTAIKLEDGTWCLYLDYYGDKEKQKGYIPFTADTLKDGKFIRSDKNFSFPYGFKHGTILKITVEEYERIKKHQWEQEQSW